MLKQILLSSLKKKRICINRMKNDYLGGIVMFVIMFLITIVQLYIFKHMKAFRAKNEDSILEEAIVKLQLYDYLG
jgi:hypothetical protein